MQSFTFRSMPNSSRVSAASCCPASTAQCSAVRPRRSCAQRVGRPYITWGVGSAIESAEHLTCLPLRCQPGPAALPAWPLAPTQQAPLPAAAAAAPHPLVDVEVERPLDHPDDQVHVALLCGLEEVLWRLALHQVVHCELGLCADGKGRFAFIGRVMSQGFPPPCRCEAAAACASRPGAGAAACPRQRAAGAATKFYLNHSPQLCMPRERIRRAGTGFSLGVQVAGVAPWLPLDGPWSP